MKIIRVLIIFFFLIGLVSHAQKDNVVQKLKTKMHKRSQRKDSLIDAGRPFLSIYAGPGYTPEAGFLIGGGLLYTFSTDPDNPDLQRSSIPLLGSISTKGSVGIGSAINSFWMDDKLRVKLLVNYSNVQDDYFGVGYEANSTIEKGKETSRYNRTVLALKPKIDVRLIPNLFAGIAYGYSRLKVKSTNEIMAEDPNYLEFGDLIIESGLEFNLYYDSRDVVVNAYKGFYANFAYFRPSSDFGGNQDFEVYELDLRYYRSITRPGNTLAFRAYGRQTTGKVPFSSMTLVGDTDLLRGYLKGQYRDKSGSAIIGEWRYMFLKKDGTMSKNGLVAWLAGGSVGENFSELNNWLPNAGVGYRLQLQPRMNLRIDFGVGKNSSGVYFNMTEAF